MGMENPPSLSLAEKLARRVKSSCVGCGQPIYKDDAGWWREYRGYRGCLVTGGEHSPKSGAATAPDVVVPVVITVMVAGTPYGI